MTTLAEIRAELGKPTVLPVSAIDPVVRRGCVKCGTDSKFRIGWITGFGESPKRNKSWFTWMGNCLTCGAIEVFSCLLNAGDTETEAVAVMLFPGNPIDEDDNCSETEIASSGESPKNSGEFIDILRSAGKGIMEAFDLFGPMKPPPLPPKRVPPKRLSAKPKYTKPIRINSPHRGHR